MKNLYVFLIIGFLSINFLHSQEYQSYLKDANIKLQTGVDVPDNVIIKATQDENNFFTVVISTADGDEEVKFSIKPFGYALFETKLKNSFPSLLQKKIITHDYDSGVTANKTALTELYSKIASYFFTINERPQVATVKLKADEIDVYADIPYERTINEKSKKKNYRSKIGKLKGPMIEISFYSGFIEKIEVKGKIDDVDVTFVNKYSIGVSSVSNIEHFKDMRLFSLYRYDIDPNPTQTAIPVTFSSGQNFKVSIEDKSEDVEGWSLASSTNTNKLFVYLNDVIKYERIIDVNANDISPDKQKIALDLDQKSSKLFREESTKILEAVVYSDLLGALEEDNPNGIIQMEIAKRFNINTARGNLAGGGAGMFEYLDGKVLLSKIEKENKYLLPQNDMFDILRMYQLRNFSVGGLLNFVSFENQDLKLNIFFESGLDFSRSGYKLSDEADVSNLNSIEWLNRIKFHFFPEKRYGLIISDMVSYYEILSKEDELLTLLNEKNNWLNTVEFKAYLDVSTSSKLFLRYRIIHELENMDNNFSQFQFGGAFFILEKNRKDK